VKFVAVWVLRPVGERGDLREFIGFNLGTMIGEVVHA
jgi:hypothetical protein